MRLIKGVKAGSAYALNKGYVLNNGVRLTSRVYGIYQPWQSILHYIVTAVVHRFKGTQSACFKVHKHAHIAAQPLCTCLQGSTILKLNEEGELELITQFVPRWWSL